MKKIFALCLLVMATVTMSAKTIKEFVVTTQPQMSCQNCENKIKKNLRFEKGVTNIQTDLENQVVVVTYDADKTNEANLTQAFAKLDYKVSPTTKANASASGKTCPNSGKTCPNSGKACTGEGKTCSKEAKACSKEAKACSGEAKACSKDAKACSKEAKACAKEAKKDHKCSGDCKDGKCKDEACKKGDDCCKNKKK